MNAITLNIKAPMYSWGYNSMNIADRRTNTYPTKSAIIGLLNAASGQINDFSYSDKITIDVFTDDNFAILKDFQVIGGGYNKNNPYERNMILRKSDGSLSIGGAKDGFTGERLYNTKVVTKEYITNTSYKVVIKSDDQELINKFNDALNNPVYPLYFGSRNCIPSAKINDGLNDYDNIISDLSTKYKIWFKEDITGRQIFDVPTDILKYKSRFVKKIELGV